MKEILRKSFQFILVFLIAFLLSLTSSSCIMDDLNNDENLNGGNNNIDSGQNNSNIIGIIANSSDINTSKSYDELKSKIDKIIDYINDKNNGGSSNSGSSSNSASDNGNNSDSNTSSIVDNSSNSNNNVNSSSQGSTSSRENSNSRGNNNNNNSNSNSNIKSDSSSSSSKSNNSSNTATSIDSDLNLIPKGWVKWTVMLDDYKNEIPYSKVYYYPNGDIILENKKGESLYYDLYYQIWNNPLVPKDWTSFYICHDENGNLNPNEVFYYYEDGRIIDSKGNVEYRILQ